jgi:hypothetical protein
MGVKRCRTGSCRGTTGWLVAILVVGTMSAVAGPAGAAGTGGEGQINLISHVPASVTTTPGTNSYSGGSSADGAFVVFRNNASNLVPGQSDSNNGEDIFLYERATNAITLVSHSSASFTSTANAKSEEPLISADGAFVAFRSIATDLVAGQNDSAASTDIFLYTRATGSISLVSHSVAGASTTGNDFSYNFSISADGAFVAFDSYATNLVGGHTEAQRGSDVFLYNHTTGAIDLVSHAAGNSTTTGNSESIYPTISANGAVVAFESRATDLVAGQNDTNGARDVFLYDRATAGMSLVSHSVASAATTGSSDRDFSSLKPSVSADGSFVAFLSVATDLVPGQSDTNSQVNSFGTDVFLYARASGVVSLVSHSTTGQTATGNAGSGAPILSADGAIVAFGSSATNLVAGQSDPNGTYSDTFLYARASGAVTLVSHTPTSATETANNQSYPTSISADGAFVAVQSRATNLVSGQSDANGMDDVFLYAATSGAMTLVSHAAGSTTTTGNGFSAGGPVSADAGFVEFGSSATNLVASQTDAIGTYDVFVFQRKARSTAPASDFNGDGKTDISVFRPGTNTWYVRNGATVPFGASGDIPVACAYDGNGTTDIAVFRPSVGGWLVDGQPSQFLGASGDVPVPGDYDGDGDCDVAVYRPSVGGWYRIGQPTVFLGLSTDIPVPADYDGNGTTDMAVYRPSVGGWYRTGGAATVFHGLSTDIPVPANYDGSGGGDIAVFRPSVGGWYVSGQTTQFLGLSGDIPVPGDYAGDGTADRAVFRPASGAWYVGVQAPVFFGLNGDQPLPQPSAIRQAFFQ